MPTPEVVVVNEANVEYHLPKSALRWWIAAGRLAQDAPAVKRFAVALAMDQYLALCGDLTTGDLDADLRHPLLRDLFLERMQRKERLQGAIKALNDDCDINSQLAHSPENADGSLRFRPAPLIDLDWMEEA